MEKVNKKIVKIILLCLFILIVIAFALGSLLNSNALSYAGVLLTVALVLVYAITWR